MKKEGYKRISATAIVALILMTNYMTPTQVFGVNHVNISEESLNNSLEASTDSNPLTVVNDLEIQQGNESIKVKDLTMEKVQHKEQETEVGVIKPYTGEVAGTRTELVAAINRAVPGVPTTIYLTNSFSSVGIIMISGGRDIILKTNDIETHTLTNTNGNHFVIEANSSLTIESGVIINGGSRAGGISVGRRGVEAQSGATFTLNGGTITNIRGNGITSTSAVGVHPGGTFIMNDGMMTHNESNIGGAVQVSNFGSFIMTGGTISHNTASTYGGGIGVVGNANITGGIISHNTAGTYGGGIGVLTLTETNLIVGSQVIFNENTADSVTQPPYNVQLATNIQSRSSSIPDFNHPLNNYDIGFFTSRNPSIYILRISRNLEKGGNVVIANQTNLASMPFIAGQIPIRAEANDGYRFVRWEVNHVSNRVANPTNSQTTLSLGANGTLTAIFEPSMYNLSLQANPFVGGTVSAQHTSLEAGQTTTINVNPSAGYRFVNWTSSNGGSFADATEPNTVFTMPPNSTAIIANFEPIVETFLDFFPDENLARVVADQFGRTVTDEVTKEELNQLQGNLIAANQNITKIEGVQYLTSITFLSLYSNGITDLEPLKNLDQLERLDLAYNQIKDVESLENLNNLSILDLSDNNISDIVSLRSLTTLFSLNLSQNHLSDLSSLANLEGTVTAHSQIIELESVTMGNFTKEVFIKNQQGRTPPLISSNGISYDPDQGILEWISLGINSVSWSETRFSGTIIQYVNP